MRSRRRFYCSITSTSTLSTGCLQYIKWESTLKLAIASVPLCFPIEGPQRTAPATLSVLSGSLLIIPPRGSDRPSTDGHLHTTAIGMTNYNNRNILQAIQLQCPSSECPSDEAPEPLWTLCIRHLCAARHRNSKSDSPPPSSFSCPRPAVNYGKISHCTNELEEQLLSGLMMGSGLGTRGTPGECRVWLASKIYTRLPPEECKWMRGWEGEKEKLNWFITFFH